MHVAKHYTELNDIMRNGVDLNIQGQTEHFNIIVFLVADLSFVKEILGKCSSSHEFGYFHCELDSKSWSSPRLCLGVPQSIEKIYTSKFRSMGIYIYVILYITFSYFHIEKSHMNLFSRFFFAFFRYIYQSTAFM